MKLQDVILKAMAKKITWLEAAEIIGVCDRTMRRMRERYQEFGYDGLFDQRRRKRSVLRVPMEQAERVLALYREKYFDLNVRHFHENWAKPCTTNRQRIGPRLNSLWHPKHECFAYHHCGSKVVSKSCRRVRDRS